MAQDVSFDDALHTLQKKGYTYNFIKLNQYFYCTDKNLNFKTHELTIVEKFRYENKFNPSLNNVLYAIEAPEYGLKGFLVN